VRQNNYITFLYQRHCYFTYTFDTNSFDVKSDNSRTDYRLHF